MIDDVDFNKGLKVFDATCIMKVYLGLLKAEKVDLCRKDVNLSQRKFSSLNCLQDNRRKIILKVSRELSKAVSQHCLLEEKSMVK